MKITGFRLFLGFLAFVVLTLVVAGLVIWAKIAALKGQLAQNLGDALGAQVEVSSLEIDFWQRELRAADIRLTNQRPEAPWDHGEISQATVHFRLHDLLASTLPLAVDVSGWKVVLRPFVSIPTGSAPAATVPALPPPENAPKGRVQVMRLSAQQGEVEIDLAPDRQVVLDGVAFDSSDNGAAVWTTQLRAASITAGNLAIGASSVGIRSDEEKITFTDLRMQCAEQGIITGNGDVAIRGSHAAHLSLQAVNVPVVMLVAVQWQMKLSGLATGDLTYEGDDQSAAAHGKISVAGGKFNVLPFLGKLTTMVGLPDIAGVEVDKATSDYSWKDHAFHLTNIDIRKNDVVRIAGQVDIDTSNQVDGRIKLGLPSTVTAKWPQLQTSVFPTATDDFNWADVHVTGTPDHLQEDLTPRLLAAGLQQAGSALQQGGSKAMDIINSLLGH